MDTTPLPTLPSNTPTAVVPQPIPARPSRRRRFLRAGAAALTVVGLSAVIFAAGVLVDRTGLLGGPAATDSATDADFALIREAWDRLHEQYVNASELDDRDLAYSAIEGITEAIGDTGHTSFLTPEEREQTHDALAGSYVGVGVELSVVDGSAIVDGVFKDSPADKAGIESGDRLVAIDGTSVIGSSLDDIALLIRGEAGTSVTVTVERDGASAPIVAEMVRAEVDVPAVSWARIPGTDLVDLKLEAFTSDAAEDMEAALEAILATTPEGIVLDLRGNGGGYVNESVSIASDFLKGGVVHLSRDAKDTFTPTPVEEDGVATDIPLVALVDQGTASSAEILAGALQSNQRAEIIGRRTYGTGTVLSEVSLSDGSALRIGVIEWLTPDGRKIWHTGIAPDHSVSLPSGIEPLAPEDLETLGTGGLAQSGDVQLLAAIAELWTEVAQAA
jgi:carboxyl-terminal processing protease